VGIAVGGGQGGTPIQKDAMAGGPMTGANPFTQKRKHQGGSREGGGGGFSGKKAFSASYGEILTSEPQVLPTIRRTTPHGLPQESRGFGRDEKI